MTLSFRGGKQGNWTWMFRYKTFKTLNATADNAAGAACALRVTPAKRK